jgi:hypothetical protein
VTSVKAVEDGKTERFEISAAIPTTTGKPVRDDEVRLIMQGLPADRFGPIQSLGLTLEAQKASVEMLVIDSVSRPIGELICHSPLTCDYSRSSM